MKSAPKRTLWLRLLYVTIWSVTALFLVGLGCYKYKYPYGWSHCCAKGVALQLHLYAADHGGKYPAGAGTPEASLSLLYSNYLNAYTLRGKTIPLKTVEQALAKDGKLGPESCGWHYVEGLTLADDSRIAIFWDKVGLGHNGERVKLGGHEVAYLDGSAQQVTSSQWPAFLDEQNKLLAQRSERAKQGLPALTAKIRFSDGKLLQKFEGSYELKESTTTEAGKGSGKQSGNSVPLEWFELYPPNGSITYELTLVKERLKSIPVSVNITNGEAFPNSIIFEMQPY